MRILIVEDDARVADFLRRGLTAEGHFCVVAVDGEEGLELGTNGDFDIVLLDLMLPGAHGLEICHQLRLNGVDTPLLMLTALDGVENVVRGLRMGADDYMTKPFSFEELLARIEVLQRRMPETAPKEAPLRAGPVEFNRETLQVTVNGDAVKLTAKELAILELLMSHAGTLFSRERILSNVWGLHMDPLTNVVDVYIGRLRRKLDPDGECSLIETVRGMGYRLNVETPRDVA